MKNFWAELSQPFFSLAPMYDVTDEAFRQMFVRYGKPDVLYTEFVSADGLANETGRAKLMRELYFNKNERPIVAQIFGSHPETIEQAVRLIKELGFDGVDINMGYPDRAVEKQGAGSALMKNPQLAREIILAAKRGASSSDLGAGDLPVSVKTRIGYNKIDTENWARIILETKPSAATFHLRTRKELSKVEAHWEEAAIIGRLGQEYHVPVSCNGDVQNIEEGKNLAKKYNLAGVMIGRGAFGRPWLFGGQEPELSKRLEIMIEHAQLFEKLYLAGPENDKLFAGHTKNFSVMRKHFKAYVNGFKGAMALRTRLMETQNSQEVEEIVKNFLETQ